MILEADNLKQKTLSLTTTNLLPYFIFFPGCNWKIKSYITVEINFLGF